MPFQKKHLSRFIAAALLAGPAWAQQTTQFDTVMVTGSRSQAQISDLSNSVRVIEKEQLEQQIKAGKEFKDALAQLIPALDLGSQSRTNAGQNMRGRAVLVMIDGVSMNSSRGGGRQLDGIDPFNIERIEVLSGTSALYGAGGLGGIINIITKKGEPGRQLELEAGARSGLNSSDDGDLRTGLALSGGNDDINGRLSLAYGKNRGAYNADGDPILMDIAQTSLQYNESLDLMGNLQFRFTPEQSLSLTAQYYDSKSDGEHGMFLGDDFGGVTEKDPEQLAIRGGVDSDRSPRTRRDFLNASYHHQNWLGQELYLQGFYRSESFNYHPFPYVNGTAYDNVYAYAASQQNTEVFGAKLALVAKPLERLSLTYGVDVDRELFDAPQMYFDLDQAKQSGGLTMQEDFTVGRYPGYRVDSLAGFMQLNYALTEDLGLNAGFRHQRLSNRVDDYIAMNQQIAIANGSATSADAIPGGEVDYDVNLFNAGLVYDLNASQQLWLNYAEGFELPDIAKYYGLGNYGAADANGHLPLLDSVDVAGSPLQGVETQSWELGWRLSDGIWDAQLAGYYSLSDKTISYDRQTLSVLLKDDKRRIYGLEGDLSVWLHDDWQAGVGGHWVFSETETTAGWRKLAVTEASPSKLTSFLAWQPAQPWSLRLQAQKMFDLRDDDGNKLEGYHTVDLLGRYQLPVGTLSAGIENLFDRDYTTIWGQRAQVWYVPYYGPNELYDFKGRGRTFSLTYNVKF